MFSLSSKPSDRSRAEYIASVEASRRQAALEEERKQRERLNFASTKEYPALGGLASPEKVSATWQKPPVISVIALAAGGPVKKPPQSRSKRPGDSRSKRPAESKPREDTEPMDPVDGVDGEINSELFPSSRRRGDIW